MAVEGADWPSELDINDPANSDDPTEGAEEIRQLKRVIVNMLGTDPGKSIYNTNVFEAIFPPGALFVAPDSSEGDPSDDLPGTWALQDTFTGDGGTYKFRIYGRTA